MPIILLLARMIMQEDLAIVIKEILGKSQFSLLEKLFNLQGNAKKVLNNDIIAKIIKNKSSLKQYNNILAQIKGAVDLDKYPVKLSNYLKKQVFKRSELTILKSTWIIGVNYEPNKYQVYNTEDEDDEDKKIESAGDLTIYTLRGTGEYTFPVVPRKIYNLMFNQTPGTIYWDYLIYYSIANGLGPKNKNILKALKNETLKNPKKVKEHKSKTTNLSKNKRLKPLNNFQRSLKRANKLTRIIR